VKGGSGDIREVSGSQPMLVQENYFHTVVREDKDEAFVINIIGHIGKSGAPVIVLDPDNKKIIETRLQPPLQAGYKITVPRDGKTGQYSILIQNDEPVATPIQLPLTTLPGEVYQMTPTMWVQRGHEDRPFTRFYTRSRGREPETIKIALVRRHRAQIIDAATGRVLSQRSVPDGAAGPDDFVEAKVGPQGVWIQAWGIYVSPQTPLTLSVSPERWFAPNQSKLDLDIKIK
jgi:hypothetical protein